LLQSMDLSRMSFTSMAMADEAACQQWCASTAECSFYSWAPPPGGELPGSRPAGTPQLESQSHSMLDRPSDIPWPPPSS
jgi:hypothetical protein